MLELWTLTRDENEDTSAMLLQFRPFSFFGFSKVPTAHGKQLVKYLLNVSQTIFVLYNGKVEVPQNCTEEQYLVSLHLCSQQECITNRWMFLCLSFFLHSPTCQLFCYVHFSFLPLLFSPCYLFSRKPLSLKPIFHIFTLPPPFQHNRRLALSFYFTNKAFR